MTIELATEVNTQKNNSENVANRRLVIRFETIFHTASNL